MNKTLRRTWNKTIMTNFKALWRHVPADTDKLQNTSSGMTIVGFQTQVLFELVTSETQTKSADYTGRRSVVVRKCQIHRFMH
jgi:hypothetical protein